MEPSFVNACTPYAQRVGMLMRRRLGWVQSVQLFALAAVAGCGSPASQPFSSTDVPIVSDDSSDATPGDDAATGTDAAAGVDAVDAGACVTATDCSDGIACTTDRCTEGVCTHTADDAACDDGIPCTADVCLPDGCRHVAESSLCPSGQTCDVTLGCTDGSGCSSPSYLCPGGCVNLSSDPNNCGSCGITCGAGGACTDGTCICVGGLSICGLGCVNLQTSDSNCGRCGQSCFSGATCMAGVCTCPGSGLTACGYDGCVDLQTSASDCGSCGNSCGPGATCLAGVCTCGAGRVDCSGYCVNTSTDAYNCGGCGVYCGGVPCVAGVCTCEAGQSDCDGSCVDTSTDAYNCGGCGIACTSGAGCTGGVCTCPGATGRLCGGTCTDTSADAANCGSCGSACTGGMTCTGGHCGCPSTHPTVCGGACADLTSDAAHCGDCGTSCPGACAGGHCTTVAGVSAGYGSGCAVLGDGTVRCWGADDAGQLGAVATGTCMDPPYRSAVCTATPLAVAGLSGVVELAMGGFHTCARTGDGRVQCWGDNGQLQLGFATLATCSTVSCSPTPGVVPGLTGVAQLALGRWHSCARMTDGTVRCWGLDAYGQTGGVSSAACADGSGMDCVGSPTTVAGLTGVTQLAAGMGHTCALLTDGTVRCWGLDAAGELGFAVTTPCAGAAGEVCSPTPMVVPGLSHVVWIAAAEEHTCAVRMDGTVQCWGQNDYGSLGYATLADCTDPYGGTVPCGPTPEAVPGLSGVAAVSLGEAHVCARMTDGTVRCWGRADNGRLGTGTTPTCSDMVGGSGFCSLTPLTVPGLTGVADLVLGNDHACARTTAGALRCWGLNTMGQVGGGVFTDALIPTAVVF